MQQICHGKNCIKFWFMHSRKLFVKILIRDYALYLLAQASADFLISITIVVVLQVGMIHMLAVDMNAAWIIMSIRFAIMNVMQIHMTASILWSHIRNVMRFGIPLLIQLQMLDGMVSMDFVLVSVYHNLSYSKGQLLTVCHFKFFRSKFLLGNDWFVRNHNVM